MTQYSLRKEKDEENLEKIIKNYKPIYFHVSPKFSTQGGKTLINKSLLGKTFSFKFNNGLKFYIDKETVHFPLKNYHGLKVEYQSKKYFRTYPYYDNPNDPEMPEVKVSAVRSVSDGYLFEIFFKGKILLEPDGLSEENYWKVKD